MDVEGPRQYHEATEDIGPLDHTSEALREYLRGLGLGVPFWLPRHSCYDGCNVLEHHLCDQGCCFFDHAGARRCVECSCLRDYHECGERACACGHRVVLSG